MASVNITRGPWTLTLFLETRVDVTIETYQFGSICTKWPQAMLINVLFFVAPGTRSLRITIFELEPILRHVHWITPQRTMNIPTSKGRSLLCVTSVFESQIRITDSSFRCRPNCFRITDYSWLQRLSAVVTVALNRSWRRKNVGSRNCHENRENRRIILPKTYLCC